MSAAEETPAAAPLDFTGAVLAIAAEEPAPEVPALGPDEPIPTPEELLVAHSFGDAAFLLPSAGAARRLLLEAIRARHRTAGRPKRRRLLAAMGGAALPPEFVADGYVEAVSDDIGAIRAAIAPDTAGLFVAPVRRSAGLEMQPGSFLADLREAADEYGLALVFDETDAGLGRTGMAFAHEWTGVTPDLMLVGEDAGLPLALLVATEKYARAMPSPRPAVPDEDRALAAGLLATVLALGFEARIQNLGWLLEDRLAALRYGRPDLFRDHVGTGLMQGLVCAGSARDLAGQLAEAGVLVEVFGDVLAVLPPVSVEEADLRAAAEALERVVAARQPAEASG